MQNNFPVLLIALMFLILQSFFSGDADIDEPNPVLDLSSAGQVRVALFGMDPPSSLKITADSALVVQYRNGRSEEIRVSTYSADLYLRNGNIIVQTRDARVTLDSLSVKTASSPARIITDAFGYRYYRGMLQIEPSSRSGELSVVNTVNLETYVASVVGSEMDFEEPEALKSQAVVSRSYALWSIMKSPYKNFDLRDYEASQMYAGEIRNKPHYKEATEATTGEIITWSDQLILAVFSSTCGGATANNMDVWGGDQHPYLRSQNDLQVCSASPHFSWEFELSRDELKELIRKRYGFGYLNRDIKKDQSGRVQQIELKDSAGDRLKFTGNEFRLLINRHAGPLAIRSTKFSWTELDDMITFSGNGLGHGVGLCQWGARGLAQNGWNYKDILTFYFSGAKIVNYRDIKQGRISLYK